MKRRIGERDGEKRWERGEYLLIIQMLRNFGVAHVVVVADGASALKNRRWREYLHWWQGSCSLEG